MDGSRGEGGYAGSPSARLTLRWGGRQAGAPQPGALTPSVWTASVVADVTAAAAAGAVGLRDVTGAPPCLGSLSVQQG